MGYRLTSHLGNNQPSHNPEFLIVGHILSPFGTRGEIKIQVMTDFPDRFDPGNEVYLDGHPLTIDKSRPHKGHLVLKINSIDDIEAASQISGKYLEIPLSEARALPEGKYYRFQILGLEVFNSEGEPVGKITDILPTGSNDVYVVQGPQGEVLIPANEDTVKSIDLKSGRMTIEAIEWLK